MTRYQRSLAAVLLLLAAPATARADTAHAQQAARMWSAFVCSSFASQAGKMDENKRLFELGYSSGQAFMKASQSGQITDDDLQKTVPLSVIMDMSGPSTEFTIGRIFEAATNYAFETVSERDASGAPLAPDHYLVDAAAVKIAASNHYTDANCGLL